MKINLMCSGEHKAELESKLLSAGFELSPVADFIFYENNYILERIAGRVGEDIVLLDCPDVILIESYGNDIFVCGKDIKMKAKEKLYMFEQMLPADRFVRVSQSVIVNVKHIKRISPAFGMKFTLTMSNGQSADVTRSYYQKFKDFLKI